ncbi:hypothetical protein O5D80_003964 [Batrachochytrium dendrobatidis]|nr:hypothetical protein O5D80_003964 [Batrachochytrium dendrobatidis]
MHYFRMFLQPKVATRPFNLTKSLTRYSRCASFSHSNVPPNQNHLQPTAFQKKPIKPRQSLSYIDHSIKPKQNSVDIGHQGKGKPKKMFDKNKSNKYKMKSHAPKPRANPSAVEMPWESKNMDPLAALKKFPVSMRYAVVEKQDVVKQAYASALEELSTQPHESIPLSTYLLLSSSAQSSSLSLSLLWKLYTGFIFAASDRLTILPSHMDDFLRHMLRQIKIVPNVQDIILHNKFAPISPIPDELKSKIEMIIQDYTDLGFEPTSTVWSARVMMAICQKDYDLAKSHYYHAHQKPAISVTDADDQESLLPEQSLSENDAFNDNLAVESGLKKSASEGLIVKDLSGSAGENTAIDSNPSIASKDSAKTHESKHALELNRIKPVGLSIEGYNAMIALQTKEIHDARLTLVPCSIFSLDEFHQTPDLNTDLSQSSEKSINSFTATKTPTQSKIWRVFTNMRQGGVLPSIETFEMWFFIFGRLHQPYAVQKIRQHLYLKNIPMRGETLLALVDASTETKANSKLIYKTIKRYNSSNNATDKKDLKTIWLKYWLALEQLDSAWGILDYFLANKFTLNNTTASMMIYAGQLRHPEDPLMTEKRLGSFLETELLRGNADLSPKIWSVLIRSYANYKGDDAHDLVVSAYTTLVTTLIPAWTTNSMYGLSLEGDTNFKLDLLTQECIAYALGKTLNKEVTLTFFNSNVVSTGASKGLIEKFMSGWIDAKGSTDGLEVIVAKIMEAELNDLADSESTANHADSSNIAERLNTASLNKSDVFDTTEFLQNNELDLTRDEPIKK